MITSLHIRGQLAYPYNRTAKSILSGAIIDSGKQFRCVTNINPNDDAYQIGTLAPGTGIFTVDEALTGVEMAGYFSKLKEIQTFTDHKAVRKNVAWRQMYNVRNVALNFYNIDDTVNRTEYHDVVLCYYCGYLLPLVLIQIDHVMPQSPNKKGYAYLKLFRALGLTTINGQGSKSQQLMQIRNVNMKRTDTALTRIQPKSYSWNDPWVAKVDDLGRQLRYTLLPRAEIVLSYIFHFCPTLTPENSLLNLVPSCSKCNTSKNDRVHVKK